MSYILDALKKAEKERRRGRTPDFMSQHEERDDNRPKRRVWVYALIILVVAAAGSTGWFLGSDKYPDLYVLPQPTAPVAKKESAQAQPPAPSAVTSAPEITSAASQPKNVEAQLPAQETVPQGEKREQPVKQPRISAVKKYSRADKTVSSDGRTNSSPETPKTAETPVVSKPAPGGNHVYAFSELPDDVRQALPSLSISTHIYSQDRSERLASINGHIAREGQEITQGIMLDAIVPDGAILRYQGYKFKIGLK